MNDTPDPELRRLVDRLHDGPPLGKPEIGRLEELLEDDAALSYYLKIAQQEALAPLALDGLPLKKSISRPVATFPWIRIASAIAAAACIAFFAGLHMGSQPESEVSLAPPKAPTLPPRITGMIGVEWGDHSEPNLLRKSGAAERIAFETGLVELTYANGVRLTLEGPADYSVTAPNSGRLDTGKLYATVPVGAEGFRVDYARGSVIDLGTEFAMEARGNGTIELGVFDGEVELHLPGSTPFSLFENQALVHGLDAQEPVHPVPLDRDKFVRAMPSRDFRWELDSSTPEEIVIEVTHLIWKPAEYRAIFKWMAGKHGILITAVRLCLDGRTVTSDNHRGATGHVPRGDQNIYSLEVSPKDFRQGRWTIHATIEPKERRIGDDEYRGPALTQGILQFEEGLVTQATAQDFIGRWSYRFLGNEWVREFHTDGRVTLEKNGVLKQGAFADKRWQIEGGILTVPVPMSNQTDAHVLRDSNTLIFTSSPFENAQKRETP